MGNKPQLIRSVLKCLLWPLDADPPTMTLICSKSTHNYLAVMCTFHILAITRRVYFILMVFIDIRDKTLHIIVVTVNSDQWKCLHWWSRWAGSGTWHCLWRDIIQSLFFLTFLSRTFGDVMLAEESCFSRWSIGDDVSWKKWKPWG